MAVLNVIIYTILGRITSSSCLDIHGNGIENCMSPSFPRRRESIVLYSRALLEITAEWIPACAGMTNNFSKNSMRLPCLDIDDV